MYNKLVEEEDLVGGKGLMHLAANQLLPDLHAPASLHSAFHWQRHTAYTLMVKMVSHLGWDDFLRVCPKPQTLIPKP